MRAYYIKSVAGSPKNKKKQPIKDSERRFNDDGSEISKDRFWKLDALLATPVGTGEYSKLFKIFKGTWR